MNDSDIEVQCLGLFKINLDGNGNDYHNTNWQPAYTYLRK